MRRARTVITLKGCPRGAQLVLLICILLAALESLPADKHTESLVL